jgi:hypothetical protein
MEWHHAASPIEKEQARTTPLAGKLWEVSWNAEGCILVDSCPERELSMQFATFRCSRNCDVYFVTSMLWKYIILEHQIARSHIVHLKSEKTEKFGWEVLPHPSHSLGLAPSPVRALKRSHEKPALQKWQGSTANSAYMVAKYWNRLLPERHIQGHVALAEIPESVWAFHGTMMGYLQ